MNGQRNTSSPSSRRTAMGLAIAAAALCFLTPAATPPNEGGDIDGARDLLQQWVDTSRQISKEKKDWALGKETLTSRIDLVRGEIEALRAKIADVEAGIADAETKRAELDAEKTQLVTVSDALAATITGFELRTKALLERLPEPLREKLRAISQSLPTKPEEADKGKLGERFLTVVGILNEVNKFNREIRAESEIRKLPDGSTVEVTTIYVGVGQAYYASANGKVAGYGAATATGWEWTAANDSAADIARAISILQKGADAAFVNLPIRVQ